MLPAELCYNWKLKSLNIAGNSIIAFTGPVRQLDELTVLDLSDNKLMRLFSDLSGLPLQELHVGGNLDLRLPSQVLEGGSVAIITCRLWGSSIRSWRAVWISYCNRVPQGWAPFWCRRRQSRCERDQIWSLMRAQS